MRLCSEGTADARTVEKSLEPDGGKIRPIQRKRHGLLRRGGGCGWRIEGESRLG